MSNNRINQVNRLKQELAGCGSEDYGTHGGTSDVWNRFLGSYLGSGCDKPFSCDGMFELPTRMTGEREGKLLCEYKYGKNLNNHYEYISIVAQLAYYLGRARNKGIDVRVLLIGTKKHCSILSADLVWNATKDFLDESYAPCKASDNEALMKALTECDYIRNAYKVACADIDSIEFGKVMETIALDVDGYVPLSVTDDNIRQLFDKFKRAVFGESHKVNVNSQVAYFVHWLLNDENLDCLPERGRMYYTDANGNHSGVVDVCDKRKFEQICKQYRFPHSIETNERLKATCDRFIEDNNRRKKGEFYTPTEFVDYADMLIAKEFGSNWKDNYVVWDCAWGTGNLTKNKYIPRLFCSTIEQGELDVGRENNTNATKFIYDFLNDDFNTLPDSLQEVFRQQKPILFIVNPPYGTSNSSGMLNSGIKRKESMVARMMKQDDMGQASKELYVQFLYRMVKLGEEFGCEVNIAAFGKKMLSTQRYKKFRKYFLNRMEFRKGIMFNAGHFSDVSAIWPITFQIWRAGVTTDKTSFEHTVIDKNDDGILVEQGTHTLYNSDELPNVSEYWKAPIRKLKRTIEHPAMNNALSVTGVEKLPEDSLGTIFTSGNSCGQFAKYFWILSGASNHMGNAVPITKDNYTQACNIVSVAKVVNVSFFNADDELMIPNTSHPLYEEFSNDAIIFHCFNGLASSLRGKHEVHNAFFWMSRDEIRSLASQHNFAELYKDVNNCDNSFTYKKLQTITLSPEAQAVLDKASEIVRKSFKYREEVHKSHPEYHLNAWDAGWYQIKKLCSEIDMKGDMDEFKLLFKTLSDKMRPMVYELGFLK